MVGRNGAKKQGKSPGSPSVAGSKGPVGLFPTPDSDEEVVVTPTPARKATSPASRADWSLFPDKEGSLGQPAEAAAATGAAAAASGGKREKKPKPGIARLLSGSPRSGPNPVGPKMVASGDGASPSSDSGKKKNKSTSKEKNPPVDNKNERKHGHKYQQSNMVASPLHAGVDDENYNDLEAARPSPLLKSAMAVGMVASEAASDDFEVSGQVKPNGAVYCTYSYVVL